MEIRKASVQDLGQIMQVYDKARKFMRENGNAEQWGEDYPSAELIEHDIDKMYLCMSEGRIACVFYYAAEEDEDYKEINGKWLNEEPYGVVHRVASTGIVRGAASFCLDWASFNASARARSAPIAAPAPVGRIMLVTIS